MMFQMIFRFGAYAQLDMQGVVALTPDFFLFNHPAQELEYRIIIEYIIKMK